MDIEKYVTTSKLINNDKSNVNWYFLRYADVTFTLRRGLNEWKHGPTDEAYEAINVCAVVDLVILVRRVFVI
jgi:hypothetical protein